MATATLPPPILTHPGHPIFGELFELRRDAIGTMVEMGRAHDVARFRIAYQPAVLITHPAGIQRVLVDNVRNYSKRTHGYRRMRAVLGNGLVTSEGDFWLRQRRIAQPAFHKKRIDRFADLMTRAAVEMVSAWPDRGELALDREMMRVTLRIVGESLLSRDVSADADEVGDALVTALEHVIHRIQTPWSLSEKWPTPRNIRFRRAMARLDHIVGAMIRDRRQALEAGQELSHDLLDMLLGSVDDETGEAMSDAQLRDEVMTIFLAGHETTAMTLTWTTHLLTKHPDVQDAVAAEVGSVIGDRAPTLADFPKLALTGRVIDEAMRLYPPVWMVARNAEDDDEILGHPIRRGDYVFMSQWVTHRREDLFADPERFDPDRFLPERAAGRHKMSYFPFSGGKRKCIGDHFALLEARLILAVMLQRSRFHAASASDPVPQPLVTLRPKDGLTVRVSPR